MTLSLEKELREALERMTAGPWLAAPTSFEDEGLHLVTALDGSGDLIHDGAYAETSYQFERDADVTGIVLLRNSAPALLDELARLREREAELEAIVQGLERERDEERPPLLTQAQIDAAVRFYSRG